MAKTAKIRIFPDTKLPFDDSKQFSPVSDQVLDKSDEQFRKNVRKRDFQAKKAKFWTKKGSTMAPIFSQNRNFP